MHFKNYEQPTIADSQNILTLLTFFPLSSLSSTEICAMKHGQIYVCRLCSAVFVRTIIWKKDVIKYLVLLIIIRVLVSSFQHLLRLWLIFNLIKSNLSHLLCPTIITNQLKPNFYKYDNIFLIWLMFCR